MRELPVLLTDRLRLRGLRETDLARFAELGCAPEVYRTTLRLPREYTIEHARQFMQIQHDTWEKREGYVVAVALREGDEVIGAIGLEIKRDMDRAELGFWIGVPFWGRGFATEAGGAVLGFGFEHLDLNRIWAGHFAGNDASGRVQQKLGMEREGVLRQALKKDGVYHDDVVYAVLREEFEPRVGWAINGISK